jgi:hypothetical protein
MLQVAGPACWSPLPVPGAADSDSETQAAQAKAADTPKVFNELDWALSVSGCAGFINRAQWHLLFQGQEVLLNAAAIGDNVESRQQNSIDTVSNVWES